MFESEVVFIVVKCIVVYVEIVIIGLINCNDIINEFNSVLCGVNIFVSFFYSKLNEVGWIVDRYLIIVK